VIRDLDDTIKELIATRAPAGSLLAGADVSFDLPDAAWRASLSRLTVNCYLYDIRENREMRTQEYLTVQSADKKRAVRMAPPVRLDCGYCITAWSTSTADAVREEHRLLSQMVRLLLQHRSIPSAVLQGSLAGQIPPYPTVIASQEGVKNQPEFWSALDQKLKPSLNYVVTLALLLEDIPADSAMTPLVVTTAIGVDHKTSAQ
jgi:hypothetical protein